MKAKLCKIAEEYFLHSIENNLIASSDNLHLYCLSRKNCQSIERGYDLDELIDLELPLDGTTGNISQRKGFKKGFEKALELLVNKMFSEEDIHKAFHLGERGDRYDLSDLLESQKITEWDVEIIMEIVDYGLDEGGNPFNSQAKLDPDGCLILKIAK